MLGLQRLLRRLCKHEAISGVITKLVRLQLLRKPHLAYLYIALFFGTAFLVCTPPCAVPDEPAHLHRIFRIAQGNVFSSAQTKLPNLATYQEVCARVGIGQDPQHLLPQLKRFLCDQGGDLAIRAYVESYPPVPYIPAAVTLKLLSFFCPSMAVYLYAARLVTFLSALVITCIAIRIAPYGRWLMVVLAVMPTRLFLMASISPDAITSAVSMLWVALVITFVLSPEKMQRHRLILFATVAIALSLTKPMYSLLLLLVFVLPLKGLIRKLKVRYVVISFLLLSLSFSAATVLVLRYFDGVTIAPVATLQRNAPAGAGVNSFLANVNPSAQASLLLHEPTRLPMVLAQGYASRGQSLLRQSTGVFGWANIYLPSFVYVFAYVLLVGALFLDKRVAIPVNFRAASAAVFGMALCVIPLMMYLMWTPVGARGFDGVLGRYYIPYIPLVFLALGCRGGSPLSLRLSRIGVIAGAVVLLTVSVLKVTYAFYATPPTGGSIVLIAQSNNTGIASIAVKNSSRGKWKNKGVINLVSSDKPNVYTCELPAQRFSDVRVILETTGSMDVLIDTIQIRTLDGDVLKSFGWYAIKQSGVAGVTITKPYRTSDGRVFNLGAQGRSSHLIIQNAGINLER